MKWFCRDGKTLIRQVVVAVVGVAALLFISPLFAIAAGAPARAQAPGDDCPTLEATRMPLTIMPVQVVRAGLTATAVSPGLTVTPPASTATITPTTPTPVSTAAGRTPTAIPSAPRAGASSATPTGTTAPNTAINTPGHYVTYLPTRQVPQQHLPIASGGQAQHTHCTYPGYRSAALLWVRMVLDSHRTTIERVYFSYDVIRFLDGEK